MDVFHFGLDSYSVYLYTILMKQSDIPEWALKYKTKGHTIKKLASGYALYSCTSQYVPGGKPKSIQHFVGMITEQDGLIPKKTKPAPMTGAQPVEYGLSYFILLNFYRELRRMFFSAKSQSFSPIGIHLGIVFFVFGDIYPYSIASCWLCAENLEEYLTFAERLRGKSQQPGRIAKKIEALLKEKIPDEEERSIVVNGLRLITIPRGSTAPKEPSFPEKIQAVVKKNGLKL